MVPHKGNEYFEGLMVPHKGNVPLIILICKLNYSDALNPKYRKKISRTSAFKGIASGGMKSEPIALDDKGIPLALKIPTDL